ncbi:MAG TPA: hypothetical protein VM324_03165 [Egibacteraceae bacterium]|nr:hypothetical protein [Egibacteraceae bacterium]
MSTLEVLDHGEPVAISFDDLIKYHGRSSIAGLAHGFKALQRALPLLAGGPPPERYRIWVDSAFAGDGARDALEMVTRAVTGDRFRPAPELAPADAPRAPQGRFFFRLLYEDRIVDLKLRVGLATDEFVDRVCRGVDTPAEAEAVGRLKQDTADHLLSLPAEEVYDADVR